MNVRATSAQVTRSNTQESDMQQYVEHTVSLSDGTEKTVLATDPMDAIEKVNLSLRTN